MRRALTAAGLVLLVAIAAHMDYHLGREPGQGYDPSWDWPYHWVLGLAVAAVTGWLSWRLWPGSALKAALLVLAGGLVVGQGVEPLLEGLVPNAPSAYPVDAERWRIFLEFVAASAVGLAAGLILGRPRIGRSRPVA